MATQKQIFRELKAALCNCPPSRLKEMTADATNGFSVDDLNRMQQKLAVIQQFINNQLLIRYNKKEELQAVTGLLPSDKQMLLKALKKGQLNGTLR